jgi:hypothetical protein
MQPRDTTGSKAWKKKNPKHPKPSNPPPETASQLAVGAKQVRLHRLNLL